MAKDFDLLTQLARFAHANDVALSEPELIERFTADAVPRLQSAIKDRDLVFGMRTERLFEAMVISLGGFRMLKSEDTGSVHGTEKLRTPDFRIVLENGEQWLVEVKNVHREDPSDQVHKMGPTYLRSLQLYADLVGAKLLVAHFWSRWGLWTLVEIPRFVTREGGLKVRMMTALIYNRLGDIGDVSINLPGPLRLVVDMRDDEGFGVQRASVSLYRQNILLEDVRDRQLAMILMQYGDWRLEGPIERRSVSGVRQLHFIATPEEESENGFDSMGPASRIFSRYYRAETSIGDQVTQLHGNARPGWFRPLATWDFETSRLGLRIFRMRHKSGDIVAEP
ncbi:hypothetical protein Q9Q95_20975 [Sphingomonas sp. DG1-23]|uniref:hypothetical protein n=1 Tax=Sphingomonas sp. DG1-23 TaxID=3068316 RepID=UPI00273DBA75|nr:hypothetical protein [Sphingomonas sp. DG1-23]MDP5281412.1 hypothetical protein [Sphingomonas sp. DG1-23]